jgi:hypothetical protein
MTRTMLDDHRTPRHFWTDTINGFSLPHALHIGQQFNEFSGTSNTYLNLGFGILLLLHLILLAFSMLILWVVGLTKRALLVHAIFSYLLLFASLLEKIFSCSIHHKG